MLRAGMRIAIERCNVLSRGGAARGAVSECGDFREHIMQVRRQDH
jgi:hypothetical protein